MNRSLLLLATCQGFFLTNSIAFMAVSGLVGFKLAPAGWLATLPLTAYVAGSAMMTPLVAKHQRQWGRKRAFQSGLLMAMLANGGAVLAVAYDSFWWLVLSATVAGYYQANASLYRFAATEVVTPDFKERALSLVLAGGILGAVLGPNIANFTRNFTVVPFQGAYLALVIVAATSLATLTCIRFPDVPRDAANTKGRSPLQLARQPLFVMSIVSCALGYGVMNLLMAATPLAMQICGFQFSSTATVLEWHVLGMFVPSFFTGMLIQRFGVLPIIASGVLLNAVCIAIALSDQDLNHFITALLLLGIGWNFLYVGGSTLLTQTYLPHEKITAQATVDFMVTATMTVTSLSSGALITTRGWEWLNAGSVVPVMVIAMVLVWVSLIQRRA